MDIQTTINFAVGAALATIGWLARELWGAVKSLQSDLHNLEIDLTKSYVTKEHIDKRLEHIEEMFHRIYDKLDNKADKRDT
jgi:hypothetical protein